MKEKLIELKNKVSRNSDILVKIALASSTAVSLGVMFAYKRELDAYNTKELIGCPPEMIDDLFDGARVLLWSEGRRLRARKIAID